MNPVVFKQHIFTSSKTRGGILTFRYTESLKSLKDFLDKIGYYDYSSLLFHELSQNTNQLYSILNNQIRIIGRSKYLGEELHTNDKRPGNFISQHYICEKKLCNLNPFQLLYGDYWLESILEEDSKSLPLHIDPKEIVPKEAINKEEMIILMSFLKKKDINEDIYAILIDSILSESKKKIILIDKEDSLDAWLIAILASLPSEVLNSFSFVCHLKNKILPDLCDIILTETLDLIQEDIRKDSFIIDVANFKIKGYECKFEYTANLIEYGIHQNELANTIEDHQLYNLTFPIGQNWDELEKGAKFFYFMNENANSCTDEEFMKFLVEQLGGRLLNAEQKSFIENQIFHKICFKTKDEGKSMIFLETLLENSQNKPILFLSIIDEYLDNPSYEYLKKFQVNFFTLTEGFSFSEKKDLLETISSSRKNYHEELKTILLRDLISSSNFDFWLLNTSELTDIRKKHGKILNGELKNDFQVLERKISQLEAIGIENGNVQIFLEILREWDLSDYRNQVIVSKHLKKICLDDILKLKDIQVNELYSLISSSNINQTLFDSKYPDHSLVEIALKIKINDVDDRDLRTLSSSWRFNLINSNVLGDSEIIQRLKFEQINIRSLDELKFELEKLNGVEKDRLFNNYISRSEKPFDIRTDVLENFLNSPLWVEALDKSNIVENILIYFDYELKKELIPKREFGKLNSLFAKVYFKYPNFRNNPYKEFNETLSSIQQINNIGKLKPDLNKTLKKINENNLTKILDKLIGLGWTSYHWALLLDCLKNKDTPKYLALIENWFENRHDENPPFSSFLKVELIVAIIVFKREIEFEYFANVKTINKDELKDIKWQLTNRVNPNNALYKRIDELKSSAWFG